MADLTNEQLRALRHAGEMLAMYAQNLLAYPDSQHAESWRNNIAMDVRRIAEIGMPQDLAYLPIEGSGVG